MTKIKEQKFGVGKIYAGDVPIGEADGALVKDGKLILINYRPYALLPEEIKIIDDSEGKYGA